MRISDWSSAVCSADLGSGDGEPLVLGDHDVAGPDQLAEHPAVGLGAARHAMLQDLAVRAFARGGGGPDRPQHGQRHRPSLAGSRWAATPDRTRVVTGKTV